MRGTPRATVSFPLRWEELPDAEPDDFDVLTVPRLFAERGDAHAGLHDAPAGLETALEWVERDERDHGLGDMPYPPEYPKMPGEPKRVQPSARPARTRRASRPEDRPPVRQDVRRSMHSATAASWIPVIVYSPQSR